MKYLCKKKEYESAGETKVLWYRIGELRENNGKEYITLYNNPEDTVYVFPKKDKETSDNPNF